MRGIVLGNSFELPPEWGDPQAAQYAKLAAQTSLPERAMAMDGALELAEKLLDPALADFAYGVNGGFHRQKSSLTLRQFYSRWRKSSFS